MTQVMAQEGTDNSAETKPVITKGVIALAHLAWICMTSFLLLLVWSFIPDFRIEGTTFLVIRAVLTLVIVILGGLVLAVVFNRIKKSSYYSLSKYIVIEKNALFKDDLWFNSAAFIGIAIVGMGTFLFHDHQLVITAIALVIILLGLVFNIYLRKMPKGASYFTGLCVLQMVKLIQLLEENDGKVCLKCRHVLGTQALHEDKCPECGKAVDLMSREKIS